MSSSAWTYMSEEEASGYSAVRMDFPGVLIARELLRDTDAEVLADMILPQVRGRLIERIERAKGQR